MSHVVDPLKMHAYSVKKPLDNKSDKIQQLYDEQKRYYPVDREGNIDEWGAIIKKQAENYEREQNEARYRKQFMQKQYGDEQKKIVQEKEYSQRMERYQAESEVQKLNQNLEYKMQLERE